MARTITIKITEKEADALRALFGYANAGEYAEQFCADEKEYKDALKEIEALGRVVGKINAFQPRGKQ